MGVGRGRMGRVDGGGINIGIHSPRTNIENNTDSLEMQHQRPSEVIIIYADSILSWTAHSPACLALLAAAQCEPSLRSTAMTIPPPHTHTHAHTHTHTHTHSNLLVLIAVYAW